MKLLILTFYLFTGIVTPTGEDEGEELYVLSLPGIEYEYVSEDELKTFYNTGEIRGNSHQELAYTIKAK